MAIAPPPPPPVPLSIVPNPHAAPPGLDFDELVRDYRQPLLGLVRRLLYPNSRDAEDVVQEAFLRAYRARATLDPDRPAWPWLATIATRLCQDWRRQSVRRTAAMNALTNSLRTAVEPFADSDADDPVSSAVQSLSERHRTLLVLHEVGGWSYRDLAALEASTTDAIKGALRRARRIVREACAERDRELVAP